MVDSDALRLAALVAAVTMTLACSSDSVNCCGPSPDTEHNCLTGNLGLDCKASPEVTNVTKGKKIADAATDTLAVGAPGVGAKLTFDYQIKNIAPTVSAAALRIASVRLEYTLGSSSETAEDQAFQCQNSAGVDCSALDGKWHDVVPVGVKLGANQTTAETIRIVFKRFDDQERSAKVIITFKGVDPAHPTLAYVVKAAPGLN